MSVPSSPHDQSALLREGERFPELKVLISNQGDRDGFRPVIVSENEVFCGPDCRDEVRGGRVRSFKTPVGVYDLAALARRLPPEQKPDLLVVRADATGRNMPCNLEAIGCPRVLIVGDTQHLRAPIRRLLSYAEQERFPTILSDHKRHHLHFFSEANLGRVFWLPAFNTNPHLQPIQAQPEHPLLFVGQAGKWHPYRRALLTVIREHGLPLTSLEAPQRKAAELYARALINLNISLNGDLNLRVFEVMSSGGFLLTDRLSPAAGLDLLFREGEHFEAYGSEAELFEKVGHYLTHPERARAIARAGFEAFMERHRPVQKANQLVDAVFSDRLPDDYRIEREPRAVHVRAASRRALDERLMIYEHVQEIHRLVAAPRVLIRGNVTPHVACDLIDLPRLSIFVEGSAETLAPETRALWQATGTLERIQFAGAGAQDPDAWNAVIEDEPAPIDAPATAGQPPAAPRAGR